MDRLEHELRDVLTHERRALSTDLVSLDAVYAGAARRRRRRTAVVAAAGAFVLAALAVPVSSVFLDNGQPRRSRSRRARVTPHRHNDANGQRRPPSPAPRRPAPWARPGPVHGVVSVTATSTRRFIVLGALGDTGPTPPMPPARAEPRRRQVVHRPGRPEGRLARRPPAPDDHRRPDVRFGSAPTDGWLYGDGLWSTHDGGTRGARSSCRAGSAAWRPPRHRAWALVTESTATRPAALELAGRAATTGPTVPDVTVDRHGDVDLTVQLAARRGRSAAGRRRPGSATTGTFAAVDNPCPAALAAAHFLRPARSGQSA